MIIILVFSSCSFVNDRRTLDIGFDNKLNADYVKNYLDSVYNKRTVIPDSIKNIFFDSDTIPADERLVYFKDKPQEWYLVVFDSSPGWITSIYNHSLSPGIIRNQLFTTPTQLTRIKKRYETEILIKAEKYAKDNHVPNFESDNYRIIKL
jgi:hypothetical protein